MFNYCCNVDLEEDTIPGQDYNYGKLHGLEVISQVFIPAPILQRLGYPGMQNTLTPSETPCFPAVRGEKEFVTKALCLNSKSTRMRR